MSRPPSPAPPFRAGRIWDVFVVGSMLAFYLLVTWQGTKGWFSPDDLMNLYYYWTHSAGELFAGLFAPGSAYYRPAVGVLYKGLHAAFGFDPVPFRLTQLMLSAANLVIFYIAARLILGSRLTAAAALVLGGVHAAFAELYYDFGMMYDVVAFTCFFAALAWYAAIRRQGRIPSVTQTIALLFLALFAIKAKESAVSLPAAIGLFELVIMRSLDWRAFGRWLRREGRVALLTGILVLANAAGRLLSNDPLLSHPAYRPEFTLARFLENGAHYFHRLVYAERPLPPAVFGLMLIAMLLAGLVLQRRAMVWCALFIPIATIPVGLILARSPFAYVIPAFAYFLYVAELIVAVPDFLLELAGSRSFLQRRVLTLAVLLVVAVVVLPAHVRSFRVPVTQIQQVQMRYRTWYEQVKAIAPRPKPAARFLVVADPFSGTYDMVFLLALAAGDPSIHVDRLPQPPAHHDGRPWDYAIEFRGGAFVPMQPPGPAPNRLSVR